MKKISSVSSDRISRMYVDRKTSVKNIANVTPVDVIKPVKNNTSYANENFMLFTNSMYENLAELREHYKKFYLHQQELEDLLNSFKESKADDSLQDIINQLEELVLKYNNAFLSLKAFEEKLKISHYSKSIEDLLLDYKPQLARIGVTLMEDYSLLFKPSVLESNIRSNPEYLFFLFDYKRGLVKKLFKIFKSIKATPSTTSNNYEKEDLEASSLAGLLLDTRL
ncbi:hypothetical protein F8154_01175 [Alkaliphilus pronyensis]|uniref:Uncharacterized protein n=1 Tax=Alkaliphilus pronyensis TaxID=1482732 RepID=A0A6I0FLS3_9FIRM|nr:hypothetical protein [Alkaliphilus pronyensis]KAB3539073.1 hypothetical protein F8154_01175 [Alkaliphilus pronyensis]